MTRASSTSIRSLRSLPSLIACDLRRRCLRTLAQAVSERDALVEHEALAAPAAVSFRNLLEISENATLKVIDLGKALREQMRARLLAADAAGAEHRDPLVPSGIELAGRELLELAEARDAGIARALEGPHRDLERVAGVQHQHIVGIDQRVPVGRIDIGADLPVRIGGGIAERDDLLLQPDLEPAERHLCRGGVLQFEIVEPAAEQRTV